MFKYLEKSRYPFVCYFNYMLYVKRPRVKWGLNREVCAGVSVSLNYTIVFLIVIQFYSFTRNIKYGIVSAKRIDDRDTVVN